MKRRTLLVGGAAVFLGAGGATTALGIGPLARSTECEYRYRCDAPIVYERDDLRLEVATRDVRMGETATFDLWNTSSERVHLGCGNPWALQTYREGKWRHVTWTAGRYVQLCLTMLTPGAHDRLEIPLSTEGLTEVTAKDRLAVPLEPGRYRLILVGPDPHLATDFDVRPG